MNRKENAARSRKPTVREELRRFYEGNIQGAALFGQQWAVDYYRSLLRELDEHPRGRLTVTQRSQAEHFGIVSVRHA